MDEASFTRAAVELAVDDEALAIVQSSASVRVPEPSLAWNRSQDHLRAREGAIQARQEPYDPRGDWAIA
ncbi:MAG: hypothetical protein WDN49_06860 [Acetobacteraceae bacterium]